MARSSQFRLLLLAVLFVVAAASAALAVADDAAYTLKKEAEATTEAAKDHADDVKKTATDEAAPTIKQKLAATKDAGVKEVEELGNTAASWKDWAVKRAGEWTGKGKSTAEGTAESAKGYASRGAESVQSSGNQAQDSATGFYSKWSNWAKDTASKYRPKKNPVSEAVSSVKQATGANENEEL